MNVVSTISHADGPDTPAAGVIKVEVTGRLVLVGEKVEKSWSVTGYVHAAGRDLLLDCSADREAEKLLSAEFGDPDYLSCSAVPVRTVQVKGRLSFRPNVKIDEHGQRVEQKDTIPVIAVESLRIVN
jgi:hypothetical protein